jgi:NADH:ubiquinone oxidoreductase subunit F (NADH-binding)/NADH:ubiquinone oxidoreductase subunit E
MSTNIRALCGRQGVENTLLTALESAAATTGTPSEPALRQLARQYRLSPAAVLGTASFYDFLAPRHAGKRGYVCTGTACLLGDRQGDARERLRASLADEEIGEMACLGRCHHGGAFQLDGDQFDAADLDGEVPHDAGIPYYPADGVSIFAPLSTDPLDDYSAAPRAPAEILAELNASRLRGRGGAGFPFARKVAACAEATGDLKYVVCNGDEGDPGAFSDRWLLEEQPHRVMAGMLATGMAVGATIGVVYVRAEYPLAVARVRAAIDTFHTTGIARDSGFRFHLVRGAGSYVCGEETALLNSIEGLRPEVRVRPPYPAQHGLFGRPTLVSNVETFACVPWILHRGGGSFAAIGAAESTGTKLVCLDHHFQRPGVHEVPMGLPLDTLLYGLGGGFRVPVKAVQIGGPLGGVVPVRMTGQLALDFESFARAGFLLGHASVVAIPTAFPMRDFLAHLFQFTSHESCGKCFPCRLGTRRGYELLRDASAERPVDAATFRDLLETLELGSLCALGGGLPLPVRNVLGHFPDELRPLFRGGMPA